MADLVKVTIFYAAVDDFARLNEVYARHMPDPPPARSAPANVKLPGLLISSIHRSNSGRGWLTAAGQRHPGAARSGYTRWPIRRRTIPAEPGSRAATLAAGPGPSCRDSTPVCRRPRVCRPAIARPRAPSWNIRVGCG
jgi:hypothetical protein